jgi:CRP/FNR family transcriptional regulator, anaerobic regulatory protein
MIPLELLKNFLPSFEPALLEEISEIGEIRHFSEGTVFMRTGQYFKSTMIILSGLVKIYREDEEGNEFFMYYLEPGKACALSFICSRKQEVSELTAKADKETEVIAIPLEAMERWTTQYKSWNEFALMNYRERFEELLLTIDQVAFRNMDERLIFYLKKHQQQHNTNLINLTHQQIATELNSSREVITRLLKKLADKNMIRLHRQNIELLPSFKL